MRINLDHRIKDQFKAFLEDEIKKKDSPFTKQETKLLKVLRDFLIDCSYMEAEKIEGGVTVRIPEPLVEFMGETIDFSEGTYEEVHSEKFEEYKKKVKDLSNESDD
jgi:hypothetical protein